MTGVQTCALPISIHLDRDVNDKGLVLDRHQHLRPTWTTAESADARELLSSLTGVKAGDLASWECRLADVQQSSIVGDDASMLVSGRLDNQLSCWASIHALVNAQGPSVVALFDHEEIGSQSSVGAQSSFLANVLERLFAAAGLTRSEFLEVISTGDRKSTRLNSSHVSESRMPSSA